MFIVYMVAIACATMIPCPVGAGGVFMRGASVGRLGKSNTGKCFLTDRRVADFFVRFMFLKLLADWLFQDRTRAQW